MLDLVVDFLSSAFACRPVRSLVHTLVFADGFQVLSADALVPYFVELRVVWLVVTEERCS